jgi:hypothetical protein
LDGAGVMGAGRIDSLDGEAAREHATTLIDADSPGPNFHSNGHSPDGKHVPDGWRLIGPIKNKFHATSTKPAGSASSRVSAFNDEGSRAAESHLGCAEDRRASSIGPAQFSWSEGFRLDFPLSGRSIAS